MAQTRTPDTNAATPASETATTPSTPVRASGYPHGTFSWVDLSSPDPLRARDFLTALFGWQVREVPMPEGRGHYSMLRLHDGDVAAVGSLPPDSGERGVWSSYVSVDDADAIVAAAERLGGSVMVPPMDIAPEGEISGRMAVIGDPAGAMLGLWQPMAFRGADYVNAPGCFSWNELVLPAGADRDGVEDFYTQLFDWEIQRDANGYGVITNRGRMNGGVMTPGAAGDMPAAWHVYFSVSDAYASAERAAELGGTLLYPAREMPGMGHFAVVEGPTGGVFTLIQFDAEPDPPPQM